MDAREGEGLGNQYGKSEVYIHGTRRLNLQRLLERPNSQRIENLDARRGWKHSVRVA